MVKHYVLDTNILLSDPNSLLKFEDNSVVIPLTVLEELDKQKSSDRDIARDARAAIRQLDEVIGNLDPIKHGVDLPTGGKLFVAKNVDVNDKDSNYITPTCNDDHIINVTLYLQNKGTPTILVSNDVCMRLKAKGIGVEEVQEFSSDVIVEDPEFLPKGYIDVPDGWLSSLDSDKVISKSCGETHIAKICIQELLEEDETASIALNDWLINEDDGVAAELVDYTDDDEWCIFRFDNINNHLMSRKAAGIKPRNVHQAIALDALLNPEIDIVILDAKAGSGKTLLAMAASCEMVKGKKSSYRMEKIIFSRSNDTQFKSLNFMRGRSVNHKVLIVDEFQNLTASQAKTILSRAGQYCKVIIMGNLGQIDNDFVSPRTSGLTYATEKFHGVPFAKVMRLEGVVRSRVAEFVEDNF